MIPFSIARMIPNCWQVYGIDFIWRLHDLCEKNNVRYGIAGSVCLKKEANKKCAALLLQSFAPAYYAGKEVMPRHILHVMLRHLCSPSRTVIWAIRWNTPRRIVQIYALRWRTRINNKWWGNCLNTRQTI